MRLVIVGKAATLVRGNYSKFPLDHQEVPWRNMRGTRNQIAHGYFALNLEVIWEIVRSDLPTLLSQQRFF